ncbi:hypothetical protein [Rurimicrobium arvi]|uniref:Cthe-2314-like HEPN domain-containing protein n=1 Tax=Rurimicrobium arvi TaxID=2049916 RepID=A0ABP8MVK1_9BACT
MTREVTYRLASVTREKYTFLRELSHKQFDQYVGQIKRLHILQAEGKLFKLIELNYQDLREKIENYRFYKDDSEVFDLGFIYLDSNRMVLNFLSSIRTYLDHTETRLKRKYGEVSSEFQLFKNVTSQCFDSSFAYRFLSKLRNYAQHCGLPAGSISLTSDEHGNTFTLLLERDNLLANFDSWGKTVKEDLKQQKNEFDLMHLIDQKFKLLEYVNKIISDHEYRKHYSDARELLLLMKEVNQESEGAPAVMQISTIGDDYSGASLIIHDFPYEAISRASGIKITVLPPI